MTHEERLAKAKEFNLRFITSGYVARNTADAILLSADLTEDGIRTLLHLHDRWEQGTAYRVGKVVRHDGILYRVITAHTSQADWTPNNTESLFTVIQPQGVIEEWGVRNLTTNPFMIGERVRFEGEVYESVINNNVWSPTGHPPGWKKVTT